MLHLLSLNKFKKGLSLEIDYFSCLGGYVLRSHKHSSYEFRVGLGTAPHLRRMCSMIICGDLV